MIATNPDFLNGDHFTLKQQLAALIKNKKLVYSSVWNWWKKTTMFWSLPILAADAALFVALVFQDWELGQGIHWLLIFSLLAVVFIVFLPIIWAITYWESFVKPRKISQKLTRFIDNHIQEATQVRGISRTNYIFQWKELEYEIAYSMIPSVNSKGKVVKQNECLIVCLHFMPDPEHRSEITDADGRLLDSFLDQCYAYCEGKDSCRTMRFEENTIYAFFRMSDLQSGELLINAMEQIQYITKRFNLIPLYLSKALGPEIQYWLQINDEPAPADIVAINIGIFETDEGYSLYLNGSKTYDAGNDDWACNDDCKVEEKYLQLPMSNHTHEDWEEFQQLVKDIVRSYVEVKAQDEKSLFYHKIVTIGFDEGNLELVSDGTERESH